MSDLEIGTTVRGETSLNNKVKGEIIGKIGRILKIQDDKTGIVWKMCDFEVEEL